MRPARHCLMVSWVAGWCGGAGGTTTTPAALLGRVSSLNTLATYGARPLGAALAAAVGALGGEVACLAFSAFCFIVQAIFLALSPIPALVSLRGPAER